MNVISILHSWGYLALIYWTFCQGEGMTVVSDLNRKKKNEEDKIHAFFEDVSAFFVLSFIGILSLYISDMR